MFRFTIRDVLWLTVVVALGVGWWADRRARNREVQEKVDRIYADFEAARLLNRP